MKTKFDLREVCFIIILLIHSVTALTAILYIFADIFCKRTEGDKVRESRFNALVDEYCRHIRNKKRTLNGKMNK